MRDILAPPGAFVSKTTWSDAELEAELARYEPAISSRPLSHSTIDSDLAYVRRFLKWRTGDYVPRSVVVRSGRPVARGHRDLAGLKEDLVAYRTYLTEKRVGGVDTYVRPPRQFLEWLASPSEAPQRRSPATTAREAVPRGGVTTRQSLPALPSDGEVVKARAIYREAEPRDIAYRVSRYIVDHHDSAGFSRGEGIAILLMSWNAGFYRFRPALRQTLIADLNELIARHEPEFSDLAARSAATYDAGDRPEVERLYQDFVPRLWPVGTAKALHVLVPRFFPLWDTAIANAFGLRLSPPNRSIASYLRLMEIVAEFARRSRLDDPLKALDEWAYVRYTLRR